MNVDNICFTEQLTFLKYVNEHYLFYSITILTFASLFVLVWILKKYTYFEKHKIARATIPTIPYGNFGDVIKHENSLHVFLWKHYNRFKRKSCKYGGLFLFMKPVILVVDSTVALNVNKNNGLCIFPLETKLNQKDVDKILGTRVLTPFVERYNYSIKGVLPEKLLNNEVSSVLKDFLLESICIAFGFHSFEIVEEINQLLTARYDTSLRYYLSLCIPFFGNKQSKLNSDLKDVLSEIIENRKKNDLQESDIIQEFIELYNESNYTIEDVTNQVFSIFADILTYSYSTIMFCLYELAHNPEIQEEVIGEVRRFNKKNRKLSYENVEELMYLAAVIKETLRKYPPIASIIKSSSSELEGCPDKNNLVFQSILGIHRDPQYYTKPEAFDPDRFTETRCFIKDTFIPFGLGPTNNLYMKFTTLQVKLILISIFSSLEVKIKDGADNQLKYNPKLLYLSPCENLKFSFVRI